MKSEPLGIEHQEILYARLRAVLTPISEYSFPNLFLFRRVHHYEVLPGEEILIRGRTYDGYRYIMPTRDPRGIDLDLLRFHLTGVDFLFPVAEEWLGLFPEEEFSRATAEGESDYVYTVEKMRDLPGRKLHKKRNLVKQFVRAYRHEARPLTPPLLDDARIILENWLHDTGGQTEKRDYIPCREALDRYEELVLCGGIYYADDEPAGFVIGEEADPGTFVLHFAKARTRFKGIYQYMFQNFASVLPDHYRSINFEQDLDKPPLRLAKSSFCPDRMVKKYRVALRKK